MVFFRKSSVERTAIFQDLKHNSDLCPKFESKFSSLLASFEKFKKVVHDIQGIHDKGTDIMLKHVSDSHLKFICFQIKSQDDLKEKNYLKTLKSQYFDSEDNFKELINYFIIVCCDTNETTYKNKVRNIAKAFSDKKNVVIIEPEYSVALYNMSSVHIDALVRNKIGSEDVVIKSAKSILSELTPVEASILVLFCANYVLDNSSQSYSINDLAQNSFISKVLEKTANNDREWFFIENEEEDEDYFEKLIDLGFSDNERVQQAIDYLNGIFIDYEVDELKSLYKESLFPVIAIIADSKARYDYSKDEILEYFFRLSPPLKGYNEEY
jgi:hypothetical protein